jgi:hypothetical protein
VEAKIIEELENRTEALLPVEGRREETGGDGAERIAGLVGVARTERIFRAALRTSTVTRRDS